LGLLFVFSGIGMLLGGVDSVAGIIASKGIPLASVIAWLVVAIKVLGGAALILGYRVGCAAAFLAGFTLLTVVFFHMNFREDINFFKNLSILGGLLYVMAYGAGEGWKLGKN
jgi:putative oxidoreductase